LKIALTLLQIVLPLALSRSPIEAKIFVLFRLEGFAELGWDVLHSSLPECGHLAVSAGLEPPEKGHCDPSVGLVVPE